MFAYIDNCFSTGKSVLYYKAIYQDLSDAFASCFTLADEKMLKAYIEYSAEKDKYYYFSDYMSVDRNVKIDHTEEIEEYFLSAGKPMRLAFMGQQYHLEVGGKDFYIDLLFYNTKLRCYVAIDLKTGEFKPEQAGKMNFYLSALDDLVKAPEDNPSVGLILCRDENRTIAEYALRDMSKPIGVSEYHLCTDLPLDLKNALPAVEDIRSRIDMKK